MAKSRTRLEKTLADYIVIAISPVLIMLLVGSLVFFLLQASYRGEFESRMHWIMFWYVFAAVLVARIAIEEGKEHALMFGMAMGAVAAIAVWRFVDSAWLGWLMLAVIWWSSSKLTWDCTVIDDSEDASGEGLLEVAGMSGAPRAELPKQVAPVNPPVEKPKKKKKRKDKTSKSKKSKKAEVEKTTSVATEDDDSETTKPKTHSPGLWVVFFSLAALPLFGIGQLFIPMAESGRRTYAFQLLAVYVASAMALLLTTSFLGLRRYLRQRKLEMPASITREWLGVGAILLVGLMFAALLVPRPQGEYSLTALIDKIDAKTRQASNWAVLKGDRAEGQGRRIGDQDAKSDQKGEGGGKPPQQDQAQSSENKQPGGDKTGNATQGKPGDQSGKDGKQPGDKSGGDQQRKDVSGQSEKTGDKSSQKSEAGDKSQKNSSGDQAQQKRDGERNRDQNQAKPAEGQKAQDPNRDAKAQQKPNPPDPAKSSSPSQSTVSKLLSSMGGPVKWIFYGILALIGLYLLIRHGAWIVEFLAKLWAEFLSLFGRRSELDKNKSTEEAGIPKKPTRPFASYQNPFYSGAADRMSSRELVQYTFEALEAWSRENSVERAPDQTALEFAEEVGKRVPELAKNVNQTALLYVHVAYAGKSPVKERVEVLERLWQQMRT